MFLTEVEVTSQDYIDANVKMWEALAMRADLIGKEVVFENRIGETTEKGRIRAIRVEAGYFVIESDPCEVGFKAPQLKYRIDEERNPHQVDGTIYCDLDDDYRQIRIMVY
jgi:hypothetical protein